VDTTTASSTDETLLQMRGISKRFGPVQVLADENVSKTCRFLVL
jgi:ABC-type sugar transport system ATPase subunit